MGQHDHTIKPVFRRYVSKGTRKIHSIHATCTCIGISECTHTYTKYFILFTQNNTLLNKNINLWSYCLIFSNAISTPSPGNDGLSTNVLFC